MKSHLFALTVAGLLAASSVFAQDTSGGGIKATTTLRDDGTRTDMVTDRDAGTAEAKTYDASKKLLQRVAYTLDSQGRLGEGTIYDAKGKALMIVSYKYNDALGGRCSEEIDKKPDGTPIRRLVYRYDGSGRLTGMDAFDAQGNPIQPSGTPASGSTRKKSRSR